MNSPRLATILAFAALVLAVVALLFIFTLKRQVPPTSGADRSAPNKVADEDRVQNAQERARMEKYIADLQASKKVLKSFPGVEGETIDCVDIYAQPALRRAGMEGHQVQLEPSTKPPEASDQTLSREQKLQAVNQLFALTGQTCPDKSAPMARLTMDTLKRFTTLDEFFKKQFADIEKPTGGGSGSSTHEYATAGRTLDNWGAEGIFNIWSPYNEQTKEFSLSQMWVARGSGGDRETVEAGWQKYYDLYGDWRSHLFIYFTPDNYGNGGCYNLSCSGFVQVNNSIYIGGGFTNYSVENGAQYEFKLLVYKDGTEGHWWLKYGDIWVGYYPRSLFDGNGLRNNGGRFRFGGEIVNTRTDNRHTRTDMGSGNWPYEGFGFAAYIRGLRYVDTSNFYQRATGLDRSTTNDNCYDLEADSDGGSWEEYFYFGGSGFNSGCP
jgi:neprosin-like protein/neprosin activation peptide